MCLKKQYFRIIAAILLVVFTVSTAMAMSVSPLSLDMTTSGKNSHGQLTVINNGAKPLPVEIVVSKLDLGKKGEMITKPGGSEEFLIFPPQAIVKPGGTQVFRLQWVGDPTIPTARSYVFSVNQVPVKMPKGKSGVQVVFNFATVVNVAPLNGSADIVLIGTGVGKDDKGKRHPALTVKNPGNLHAKFTDATVRVSAGSWSKTFTPQKLKAAMGMGLLQPGKTRRFLLPVDMPVGVQRINAKIDYTFKK
jgi:P pilus assembly chaperone PapD